MNEVDHSKCGQLLRKYVDKDGMVDYKSWKASTTDLVNSGDYRVVYLPYDWNLNEQSNR